MSILSIGDLAQSFMLRRHTGDLKTDLQTLAQEMTTGRTADLAAQVGGDFKPLASLTASLARLQAFGSATAEAVLFCDGTQAALGVVDSIASDLAPDILQVASGGQRDTLDVIAADAHQKFRTAVATLNTRIGDRTLMAGKATQGPALANADDILVTLDTLTTGMTTALDVEAALDAWFDDPAGFSALAYLGDEPLEALAIAPGEVVAIGVTADHPAICDTLKGLAMAALLDRGSLALAPEGQSTLAARAGETLMDAQSARTQLSARVGVVQEQIAAAESRNSAEASALEIARARIVSVDPYETATRLEETQTQLETLYAITARLSRLSLTDYLG